jgi:hypothetical protein
MLKNEKKKKKTTGTFANQIHDDRTLIELPQQSLYFVTFFNIAISLRLLFA